MCCAIILFRKLKYCESFRSFHFKMPSGWNNVSDEWFKGNILWEFPSLIFSLTNLFSVISSSYILIHLHKTKRLNRFYIQKCSRLQVHFSESSKYSDLSSQTLHSLPANEDTTIIPPDHPLYGPLFFTVRNNPGVINRGHIRPATAHLPPSPSS